MQSKTPARGAPAKSSRHFSQHPRATALLAASALLSALLLFDAAPAPASEAAGGLEKENARLRDENEQLRRRLEALQENPTEPVPAPGAASSSTDALPEPAAQPRTSVEASYVPMNRVSLTVSRDAAGQARVVATPWYRAIEESAALPRREFIQFRAAPARAGAPQQVWMSLQRRSVHSVVDKAEPARLQIGSWSGKATVVEQDIERNRRKRHKGKRTGLRDELVVFALPAGALERLAISDQSSFETDSIRFTFTDEQVAAAAAMVERLERERRERSADNP